MKRILLLFILLVSVLQPLLAQNWEIDAVHRINSWDRGFLRQYNKVVSHTEPYLVAGIPVAMAVVSVVNKDEDLLKDALYVGTSVAGTFVINYGMKHLVNRRRPYEKYPDRVHPYTLESGPSFPSGHTACAFALATSLSLKYPKWYVIAPCAVWACSMGVSRLNEGVHYPTDVVAGAAVGIGCAVANLYVNRWLNKLLFGKH